MRYKKYQIEFKILLKLAWPIMISQLGVVLMGVIDNMMIGQFLDKEALAAASLGGALSFLISSIAVGGIPVIAPLFAKKDGDALKKELSDSLASVLVVTLLLSLVSIGVYFSFSVFKQPIRIESDAKFFFLLISISNIPLYFFLLYKQLFDSLHLTKISMWITFAALLFNTLVNYFFINGFQGWVGFGLNGAAYATILTRFLMLFLIYRILKATYKSDTFLSVWSFITNHFKELWQRISIIFYSGVQAFFEIGAFTFAVIMMGWINATALAAHQIAINIASVAYMMATGIAYAAGIRIGDALKLDSFGKARISGNVAILSVVGFMIITASLIFLFREGLVGLYIKNDEVTLIAVQLLIIAALFQISDGVQAVVLGCLRGLTDVRVPALMTFIAYWVISLPIGYFLCFNLKVGPNGIWYGLLIGLTIAAIFLLYRFYQILGKRKIRVLN